MESVHTPSVSDASNIEHSSTTNIEVEEWHPIKLGDLYIMRLGPNCEILYNHSIQNYLIIHLLNQDEKKHDGIIVWKRHVSPSREDIMNLDLKQDIKLVDQYLNSVPKELL